MGKETNQGYQVSKLIRGDTLRVHLTIVSQRSSKPTSVGLLRGYREKDVRLLTAISADILWEPQLRLTFVTLKPTYCNTPIRVRHQRGGTTVSQCTHQGILLRCAGLKSPFRPIMDSHMPMATRIE